MDLVRINYQQVERDFIRAAVPGLHQIGRALTTATRQRAPVRTGALRDEIDYEVDVLGSSVRFGVLPSLIPRRPGAIQSPALYARFVELRTHPFIRPSFDELAPTLPGLLTRG